jgi:UDP-glucuronate 4-epimerase
VNRILVTGAAGFIGFHTTQRLLKDGNSVVGIDNLNDYYDVNLKRDRLQQLTEYDRFQFEQIDIADKPALTTLFDQPFDAVVNLAAQPGVRYSIENPAAYFESNLVGFGNVLECCRQSECRHLVYASSSSVYGQNRKIPFSADDPVDHPISLYAATKKANELMAHSYSHLYNLPTTGLRFFTVYGPWGRPDMAVFLFADAIINGRPIDVYNEGKMRRDFTYIDDIVEGVVRVIEHVPQRDDSFTDRTPAISSAPYRVYNIGNSQPVELLQMIETLEKCLGKTAKKNMMPMQPGDVPATYADIDALTRAVGFQPTTSLADGIREFVNWYQAYYTTD